MTDGLETGSGAQPNGAATKEKKARAPRVALEVRDAEEVREVFERAAKFLNGRRWRGEEAEAARQLAEAAEFQAFRLTQRINGR